MNSCKKCGSRLEEHGTFRVKENGSVEEVGRHEFCMRIGCDFECDLPKRKEEVGRYNNYSRF